MKLIAYRKNLNLSREEIAVKLGVSISTYTNWETGKCEPTVSKAKKLADLLETDIYSIEFGK